MEFSLEPYIPYKGNKFGIVEQIYQTIRTLNMPQPLGVYDAFTGGGSFAYFMARQGYKVLANDLDESVIALHKACKETPNKIAEWGKQEFTKEEFKKWLGVETAQAALIRSLWSFSNDGRTYLTSSEKEAKKLEDFRNGVAEPNSRFKHIEDICLLWARNSLDLEFCQGSYDNIQVPEGFIVYCDPPYANTVGYRSGGFDHEAFYAWALAQPGLVLISEYSMPEPFVLVDEYFKWVESGRGARGKAGVERLYANKPVKKLSLF
jgi:site-specific DNA-adenine methylase